MQYRQALGIVAALLLVLSTPLRAATPNLAGDWIAEIAASDVSNGITSYYRFTLAQNGSVLTGSIRGNALSGTVQANGQFELRQSNQFWKGTVKDGTLSATTADTQSSRPLSVRAYREVPPSRARTHVFEPKEFHRLLSGSITPVLRIAPGDTVKTSTIDATGQDAQSVRRSAGGNPQTGPFYVEGALPGDTLVIRLLKIQLNRNTAITTNTIAANALEPSYFAQLGESRFAMVEWQLDRAQGVARLSAPTPKMKNYRVPLRPFLGCIGVAPPERAAIRTSRLGAYGGNLDYNRLVEGTAVYLPVFQIGALLFIGDGHAAQGDGELAGNALETSLDVEFSVEVIRNQSVRMPRAENSNEWMASGISGSLNEALQSATTNLSRWLQERYQVDRYELSTLLGTAMSYDIAEIVDTEYHVVARMSKQLLEGVLAADD
jgi:acetamidase/formamidase